MKAIIKVILASSVALFLTACGSGGSPMPIPIPTEEPETVVPTPEPATARPTPYPEPDLVGMYIRPVDTLVGVGQEVQLDVDGIYEYPIVDTNNTPQPTPPPSPGHNDVIWESSDETVATVDSEKGLLKAVSVGQTIIEANTVLYYNFTADLTIDVIPAYVTELIIIPSVKTINVSDIFQFRVDGLMTDETIIPVSVDSWETTNDAIASIDSDGTVEGIAKGTVTIKAQWYSDSGLVEGEAILTVE